MDVHFIHENTTRSLLRHRAVPGDRLPRQRAPSTQIFAYDSYNNVRTGGKATFTTQLDINLPRRLGASR